MSDSPKHRSRSREVRRETVTESKRPNIAAKFDAGQRLWRSSVDGGLYKIFGNGSTSQEGKYTYQACKEDVNQGYGLLKDEDGHDSLMMSEGVLSAADLEKANPSSTRLSSSILNVQRSECSTDNVPTE